MLKSKPNATETQNELRVREPPKSRNTPSPAFTFKSLTLANICLSYTEKPTPTIPILKQFDHTYKIPFPRLTKKKPPIRNQKPVRNSVRGRNSRSFKLQLQSAAPVVVWPSKREHVVPQLRNAHSNHSIFSQPVDK